MDNLLIGTILRALRNNRDFMSQVAAWEQIPARAPHYQAPPFSLSRPLAEALIANGLSDLFAHQVQAIEAALSGRHVIIATATASGKTLCYNAPVLDRLLQQPGSRALYLFPTKALAQDQLAETNALLAAGDLPVTVHTYDGDTPSSRRRQARESAGILISNPDMLHAGILPNHPRWRAFFANLDYVVLDEIHAYRGVFGSHVANVLRRLRRICDFYGSRPQFICCSATIANAQEHAERLVEQPFTLIGEASNGSPLGRKEFILYNPPIIDESLGLRSSTVLAAKDAALTFLSQDVQTIVFARARQTVELLLSYLQDELEFAGKASTTVAGYRGGYLPLERRKIERGLRDGTVRGVVATNALELGIDIGELTAAVLTGYPGTIASTWQQAGRAGRRSDASVAIMVAANNPLDQYICQHPQYLFGRSPESALINADNLQIMSSHLLCAAFELPFAQGESFGLVTAIEPFLDALVEEGLLHETQGHYHWIGDGTPASRVSLRTSGAETVVIQDVGGDAPVVIGELDLESVPSLAYEGAIYLHQAQSYLVEELDWEGRIANVRPVEVDYYTRSSVSASIKRLQARQEQDRHGILVAHGDTVVGTKAASYRKIKRFSHETLGFGEIDLPEITLETAGYWIIFTQSLTERLWDAGILLRPNNYGPNWQSQRRKALQRDQNRCQSCGAQGGTGGIPLHIHHIRPFREFGYVPDRNENYVQANQLHNLVTLCASCHRRAESGQQTRSAMGGLGYTLRNLAPLFLMCDPADIEVSAESQSPLTKAPTIVIYERVAAGVGFCERLYELHDELLAAALELVVDCRCRDGCPACVGPPADIGPDTKEATARLLQILIYQEGA